MGLHRSGPAPDPALPRSRERGLGAGRGEGRVHLRGAAAPVAPLRRRRAARRAAVGPARHGLSGDSGAPSAIPPKGLGPPAAGTPPNSVVVRPGRRPPASTPRTPRGPAPPPPGPST